MNTIASILSVAVTIAALAIVALSHVKPDDKSDRFDTARLLMKYFNSNQASVLEQDNAYILKLDDNNWIKVTVLDHHGRVFIQDTETVTLINP